MNDQFLYERVAARFELQVHEGILMPGDKLPSVRMLSREQGVSLSTAYKVYVELENKGLIEARNRSGYYVRKRYQHPRQVPSVKSPLYGSRPVSVADMISAVFRQIPNEHIQLSRALPAAELMPVAKLNKSMLESLRRSDSGNGHYETLQGNLALRKQIAKHSINWGGAITPDDVVTTQGCIEALVFCLRALTKPGDTVAIESPTYFGIFNIILSLSLKVVEIPVDPEEGLDIAYLERAMEAQEIKACVFVTNFNNPTGALMPDQQKRRLVGLLKARHIPLIEDDIYGDLYFGRSRPLTCKAFDDEGLVLLCSSVSKSLAPGYRVGWCMPGRFKEEVLRMKMMNTISSATPTQAAIANFFETGRYDLHLRKLRKALHLQCLHYTEAIVNAFPPETRICEPKGGYALWIELNPSIDAFFLFQMAREYCISIAPGQVFSTDARFHNFIRISFGTPLNDEIRRSIRVLGSLVTQSKRQAGISKV
jgi:DNA-binding transcriptional MocR family regulator